MSVTDCIFCRIISKQLPAVPLYEDDLSMAFMDINPVAPGHVLVVAKQHSTNLFDVPAADLAAVAATTQRLARAVNSAFSPDGLTLVQSNGPGAAQSVEHFHIHILPRSLYDDLPMNWRLTPGNRAAIKDAARKIRAALTD